MKMQSKLTKCECGEMEYVDLIDSKHEVLASLICKKCGKHRTVKANTIERDPSGFPQVRL